MPIVSRQRAKEKRPAGAERMNQIANRRLALVLLGLLATVIIGVIQGTWMIARDVFRDKPSTKHNSDD